uniref:Uncharacterized protein n=1 Tax=Anguilla anguilla TaxID=7936 RepID=A0A0E9RK89_ANGAN
MFEQVKWTTIHHHLQESERKCSHCHTVDCIVVVSTMLFVFHVSYSCFYVYALAIK